MVKYGFCYQDVLANVWIVIHAVNSFVYWNSTAAMKMGLSWEGTDVVVKLVGYRHGLWVVLLQVSWAWNMSNITSKNSLILRKKKTSTIPSCAPKIPLLHSAQITPPKYGVFEMWQSGYFCYWNQFMERELVKKIHLDGIGVVYMSPFWVHLHSKFVCFCPCVSCVTVIESYKRYVMWRRRCFQTWIIFRRILAFPLHPRYIRCSTMITSDIVEFNWFETTCLLPKSAAVIEVISVDWPELF